MQASYILDPMIRGLMLTWSRVVFLQEFTINRHHKYIAFWTYQAICPIWVDSLYQKWSFLFELKFSFRLVRHHHWPFDSQDEVTFLESSLLNFLVEGSENLSLIKLDLLLSLQAFVAKGSSSWSRSRCFSSSVISVVKATCRDRIWISNGSTTSHLYTKKNGVAFVGVLTVVR